MIAHGGTVGDDPYRPLPGDFAGPICAECRHSWVAGIDDRGSDTYPNAYRCGAIEPEIERHAERDPVTGKVTGPWYRHVRCVDQNRNGDCDKYEAKAKTVALWVLRSEARADADKSDKPQAQPTRPIRRLAARLGAWLLKWGRP